jgi:FkbM family methyltransferase
MYNVDTSDEIRLKLGLPVNVARSIFDNVRDKSVPLVAITRNWWDALFVYFGARKSARMEFRDGAAFELSKDNLMEFFLKLDHDYAMSHTKFDEGRIRPLRRIKMDEKAEVSILREFNYDIHACLDVKGKDVIDLGANVGDTSLYYVLRGKAKHVYAIEAYSYYCDIGKSLVKANRLSDRITMYNCAVGERDGTVYTAEDKSDYEVRASRDETHTVPMRCYSLDSLVRMLKIGKDAALKVDVEGSEYGIFRTASMGTLKRFSGIHIEYHYGYADLVRRLEAAGFEVKHTRPVYGFGGLSNRAKIMGEIIATRAKAK